jgi:hypothetical protein
MRNTGKPVADPTDDGSYLSKPDMSARRRRLFTFTHPILLSHDGSIVATAAEGVEDDSPDEAGFRFLVLDAVWDGKAMQRIDGAGIIGVWVNPTLIASAQVQAASLLAHVDPLYRKMTAAERRAYPQLLPEAPPPPAGTRPRDGVEMGCGKDDCTDCYEPEGSK